MKLVLLQPRLTYARDASNVDRILGTLGAAMQGGLTLTHDDIVLLPEHYELRASRDEYLAGVRSIASLCGAHIVGGSHHEITHASRVNSGVVVAPDGTALGSYEKLRPYARERESVGVGTKLGEFVISGRRVLTLICADFWFSDLFDRATALPDLVLVPALSVTRKPTGDYSRGLWRHLSIARAYEFGTYVGVSDWASATAGVQPFTSGVGGFTDPTVTDPGAFFQPIDGEWSVFDLDFARLDDFRRDRADRGFFWRKPTGA